MMIYKGKINQEALDRIKKICLDTDGLRKTADENIAEAYKGINAEAQKLFGESTKFSRSAALEEIRIVCNWLRKDAIAKLKKDSSMVNENSYLEAGVMDYVLENGRYPLGCDMEQVELNAEEMRIRAMTSIKDILRKSNVDIKAVQKEILEMAGKFYQYMSANSFSINCEYIKRGFQMKVLVNKQHILIIYRSFDRSHPS
ncbi:hypothetical protein [Treponema sp. R6D11]